MKREELLTFPPGPRPRDPSPDHSDSESGWISGLRDNSPSWVCQSCPGEGSSMEGTPSAGPPRAAGRKEQVTDTKASVPRRRPSQAPTTPSLTCLWLGERPRSTDPHCPVGPVGTPGQRPWTRQDPKSLGVHQRTEEGAQRCSNIEISRSHKIRIPEASF